MFASGNRSPTHSLASKQTGISEEEDSYEILTTPEDFSQVREALEKEGVPMAQAMIAVPFGPYPSYVMLT